MPAKKLVVSTYLQSVLIGLSALVLFALLIGPWAAVTGIIPVIGAVPAVLIPLFTGDYAQALLVAVLFLIARQIEGNLLVPRIMGSSALYCLVDAVFRYPRGALLFERWHEAPVVAVGAGGTATLPERPAPETDPAGEVPTGTDGGMPSPGTGR